MSRRFSFREVKAELVDKIDHLARELLPDGYYGSNKKYWMACNPSRADGSPGSFWIWLTGPKAGGWCDAASDQKGDVFGLIQLVRGGSVVEAKEWALWWTGLDRDITPAERQARAVESDRRKQKAEAEAAATLERNRRTAHAIWLNGEPLALKDGRRNPAAELAFHYLENRGIDLSRLPRLPGATRLLFDQKHYESGKTFAALGSCIIDAAGKFIALHRVFITDAGEKIDEKPVRKSWPDYLGGYIPIWDAGTGMSAVKQSRQGHLTPLIACEGVEDGYAAAIGAPDHRVRAACALGNLRHMPILPCDDRLVIWRDNDWGKPQAEKQLLAAAKELSERGREQGCEVALTNAYFGKDINDQMRGE